MNFRSIPFLMVCFLFCLSYSSSPIAQISPPIFLDKVTAVEDFPVLRLKSGHQLVLSGVERPATHAQAQKASQLKLEPSRNWLANQLIGQEVIIQPTDQNYDIFGRIHGLIKVKKQEWTNIQLLQQGLARLQSRAGFNIKQEDFFQAEQQARQKKIGLWGKGSFKIYNADDYQGPTEGFIIAEGTLVNVSNRSTYIYLNFGENWRTDFTAAVPRKNNHFDSEISKLKDLIGRKIQVRGVIEKWNGPFMRITLPDHIITLD